MPRPPKRRKQALPRNMGIMRQYLTDNFGVFPEHLTDLKNGHLLLLYTNNDNSIGKTINVVVEKLSYRITRAQLHSLLTRAKKIKCVNSDALMSKYKSLCCAPFTSFHCTVTQVNVPQLSPESSELQPGSSNDSEQIRPDHSEVHVEHGDQQNQEEPSRVVDYLDSLMPAKRKQSIDFSINMASKTRVNKRKRTLQIRLAIASRLSEKRQRKETLERNDVEKKLKACDAGSLDINVEFANVKDSVCQVMSNILAGNIVGHQICHVWLDSDTQEKVMYYGKVEKLLKKGGGTYRVGYWGEGKSYEEDAEDYDVSKYALAADLHDQDKMEETGSAQNGGETKPDTEQVDTPNQQKPDTDRAVEMRKRMESWLNQPMRIQMTDGRTLVGTFICTDKDRNVILGSCEEYVNPPDSPEKEEPRVLGLAMVPGQHIVSIEIDEGSHSPL